MTLFAFTNAWNEFLFAFVFITSDNLKTLPVGLQLVGKPRGDLDLLKIAYAFERATKYGMKRPAI